MCALRPPLLAPAEVAVLLLRLPRGPHPQLYVPQGRRGRCGALGARASDALCAMHPLLADNWGKKAIGRKTTGTGRCRYLKDLPRKFKNGFREGARAPLAAARRMLKP